LLEGLSERGYVVGRNLQIEYRYSQAQTERIPALVAELVASGPEVIVALNPQNSVAVHTAAPTIPLVFLSVADPMALGLVESLAHPGGNVTGFATLVPGGFVGKQLQFLKAVVPQASRIAVLINPTNPIHQREKAELPEIERHLVVVEASKPDQLEPAFETAHRLGAEGIHVFGDALIGRHSATVAGLAARTRRGLSHNMPLPPTRQTRQRKCLPVQQPTRSYLIVTQDGGRAGNHGPALDLGKPRGDRTI
jgi:putative ABC transport system substrate-binding protein